LRQTSSTRAAHSARRDVRPDSIKASIKFDWNVSSAGVRQRRVPITRNVRGRRRANRRVQTFAAHLEAMQEDFDYCLLDPPPRLGIRMIAALASADFVTVPIELEEYSTQGVKDMLQTVFGVRQQWNPKLKFMGILANRFMHNSTRQKAALQDLFENYQDYAAVRGR